ncbi:hypothetical protein ACHAQD_009373 [Fusarium lateritium]
MAEIEMDIDVAKSGIDGLDGPMEDDIIDFDTDMVDSNQDLQKHDGDLEATDRDMQEDEDLINNHAYETNGMASETVEFDLHDVETAVHGTEHVDYEVVEAAPESQTKEPTETTQSPNGDTQEHEKPERLHEGDDHGDMVSDDRASAHEIDYEFEDNVEPNAPQQDVIEDATHHSTGSRAEEEANSSVDHDGLKAVDDITAAEQDTVEPARDTNAALSREAQNEPRDQHEATSKDEEGNDFDGAGVEDVSLVEHNESVDASDNEETPDEEHSDSHEEVKSFTKEPDNEMVQVAEDIEDHDYDKVEFGQYEYDEDATADPEHADHSGTNEDMNGKADENFPAITVQYKGDEFPLFSATTNGFFADVSVLDEPLRKLLAGFRSELENEIADDDDLVFQVDELGLELAETTQGELMTNVTFRQILEIFDLLVKNQDPDSSRTLYTYLFTKPNTEKRLESLIESATAGKGLDEVIHLFETPMTAGTSMLETSATIDGVHEELDEFDSPVDEEHPDETDVAADDGYAEDEQLENEPLEDEGLEVEQLEDEQPEAEQHEDIHREGEEVKDQQLEDERTNLDTSASKYQEVNDDEVGYQADDQDDHEIPTETLADVPADGSTVEANTEDSGEIDAVADDQDLEQNGKTTSLSSSLLCCYSPNFCLCGSCVAKYVEDHERDEAEYRRSLEENQDNKGNPHIKRQFLPSSPHKHAQSHSDFSTTFSFNRTDEFSPARADSEIDPFANFELDEDTEVNDDVNGDVVFEEKAETKEEVVVETEDVHAQTIDTSTTTTLQEEEEAASFHVDLGAVSTEVETTEKAGTGENDLDEIDWRDEPEAEDQEPTTPSAAGKRSRGDDDDVGAEDEQDAKRRRP